MKISQNARTALIVGGSVVGVVLVLRFVAKEAGGAVGRVFDAINPVNNDNVVSQLANGFTEIVTGEEGTSVGSALFDFIERLKGNEPFDPNEIGVTGSGVSQEDLAAAALAPREERLVPLMHG